MRSDRPLVICSGSSSSDYGLPLPPDTFFFLKNSDYNSDVYRHYAMLSGVTPSPREAVPLFFIKTRPAAPRSAGTSQGVGAEAAKQKYEQLALQLEELRVVGDDIVEQGAVETASAVLRQFSKTSLAPPEISWMGSEAIVMLWMLGSTKYALTITDGEVGYVVRADGKTLRRNHGIALEKLDTLRLS